MASVDHVHDSKQRQLFKESGRTHVLQITNHGMHEWKVIPGLPDTGGQNVYVNQFTEALINQGYRVTIANRGGYEHPQSGRMQAGIDYHPSGYGRIVYLEDGTPEFVRKEDMDAQIPALVDDLYQKVADDGDSYDLIISHYWDAAKIGYLLNDKVSQGGGKNVPHVWVPHSLGALKKRNMDPSTWANLRIDERIANESEIIKHIDGGVSTSTAIRDTFKNDYGYDAKYFLPPCIDERRFLPLSDEAVEPIWGFLAEQSKWSADELKKRRIVTEISRTDRTKRKDVVIKSFAMAKKQVPEALLLLSIDPMAEALYQELTGLIQEHGLQDDVIVLGSVWEQLPKLYNITHVYCTPSVMEGFGMTAQEAAACGKPVVSSDLVPFVVEYLLGENAKTTSVQGQDVRAGQGAYVVPADFVEGFAFGVAELLKDESRRATMGQEARDITIPYFTWKNLTAALLNDLGVSA